MTHTSSPSYDVHTLKTRSRVIANFVSNIAVVATGVTRCKFMLNDAFKLAVSENHTLEPNMKWMAAGRERETTDGQTDTVLHIVRAMHI